MNLKLKYVCMILEFLSLSNLTKINKYNIIINILTQCHKIIQLQILEVTALNIVL